VAGGLKGGAGDKTSLCHYLSWHSTLNAARVLSAKGQEAVRRVEVLRYGDGGGGGGSLVCCMWVELSNRHCACVIRPSARAPPMVGRVGSVLGRCITTAAAMATNILHSHTYSFGTLEKHGCH
jgi:hypothetical protein